MSGWIPQVYYDFLARIVPGSAVVLGALYLRHGPSRGINFAFRVICEQEHSWVCRFGIGLLAAYLIGLILGELGEFLAGRVLRRRDSELEKGLMRECLDGHSRALEAVGREPVALQLDDLPDTGRAKLWGRGRAPGRPSRRHARNSKSRPRDRRRSRKNAAERIPIGIRALGRRPPYSPG